MAAQRAKLPPDPVHLHAVGAAFAALDLDERRALLRVAVAALRPDALDLRAQLFVRGAAAQRAAQVGDSPRLVQK